MHKTARQVRFSINPFLPSDTEGYNSYASKPSGEGLSIFFELLVEVAGEVEPATGFVVNVDDIDENVRRYIVPIFAERIRENFRQGRHIGFFGIVELLADARGKLANKFGSSEISKVSLSLNPFRKVEINSEDLKMIYFSEKFEFAATHKLWNEQFSEKKNFEVFGKCANPTGHGHNYIVEVTIKKAADNGNFCITDFEKIVDDELVRLVDHKNLNADVAEFEKKNATVENIAAFGWEKLAGKFAAAELSSITVWETDRTYCTYCG